MPDDAFSHTLKIKRNGGDDVQKCNITAPDIETLEQRVEQTIERMETWADDISHIGHSDARSLADDQGTLQEVSKP